MRGPDPPHRALADDFGKEAPLATQSDAASGQQTSSVCVVRTQDIPEPETKNLVLRMVSESDVVAEDLPQYFDPSKYRYVPVFHSYDQCSRYSRFMNEYIVEGQRLIHKDIVLTLHRILYFGPQDPSQATAFKTVLPPLENIPLLDTSGAFILEACVRVDDRTKPALIKAATEELGRFKNEMKGSVDLRNPERLALDTRVKN